MLTRIRTSDTYTKVSRHEATRQFVRYAVVGVLNVVLFFAILNVLLFGGVGERVANAIAFLSTTVNSFLLNKNWAFRDRRKEAVFRQYLLFVGFTLIGLVINTAAFSLFHIPLRRFGTLGTNAAALCALPLSVVWNFTTYRKWTFNRRVGSPAQAGPS